MPPQDRGRFNDTGQTEQARPQPARPSQQRAITGPQPQTWRSVPQGDVQLMTEKQVLGFKPASRLEQIGEIRSKQVGDREHRMDDALILTYCANPAGSNFRERQDKGQALASVFKSYAHGPDAFRLKVSTVQKRSNRHCEALRRYATLEIDQCASS